MIVEWLLLAGFVVAAIAFESRRVARVERECAAEGHLWARVSDPEAEATLVCTRCEVAL